MNHFTFSWGNNYIAVRALLRAVGHKLQRPPRINASVIERGIQAAHPFLCFSGKLVLGQLQQQVTEGAERMVFMSSLGPEACRCADTSEYMESLFCGVCPAFSAHRIGGSGFDSALANLRAHFGPGVRKSQCVRGYAHFFRKLDLIHKVEKCCAALRCLSSDPLAVRLLETEALARVDEANGWLSMWNMSRWFDRRIAALPKRDGPPRLRIGVVGGEHILSELGDIMQKLKTIAETGVLLDWRGGFRQLARADDRQRAPLKQKCRTYLTESVSTSELYSCAHAIDFVHEGYDGLLHIYAFGCMPQTALKPILQRLANDNDVPMLSLSIGDRFADEGLENRVEAFIDLLDARRPTQGA